MTVIKQYSYVHIHIGHFCKDESVMDYRPVKHFAREILKHLGLHANPSRNRSFSKSLFKSNEFDYAGFLGGVYVSGRYSSDS